MSPMIQCLTGAPTQARNKSYENRFSPSREEHMGLSVGPFTMSPECGELWISLWNELFLSPTQWLGWWLSRHVVTQGARSKDCDPFGLSSPSSFRWGISISERYNLESTWVGKRKIRAKCLVPALRRIHGLPFCFNLKSACLLSLPPPPAEILSVTSSSISGIIK